MACSSEYKDNYQVSTLGLTKSITIEYELYCDKKNDMAQY